MLHPKRKITKQDLKEDKFVTDIFKAREYIETHTKEVTYLFGALFILAALVFIWRSQNIKKEARASLALTEVVDVYQKRDYPSAIIKLKDVLEKNKGTPSAGLAAFYLANAYYQTGDYEKGSNYFQLYIDKYSDNEILVSSSYGGLGACAEQRKEFARAGDYYQKAATKFPNDFSSAQNLYSAGRCFQSAGNTERAREIFKKILKDFPENNLRRDAEFRLAQL